GEFAYKPEIEQYGYHHDPAKAKALLDDAGWVAGSDGVRQKGGKKLELLMWCGNFFGSDAKVVQVIQNQLAAVGMSVKIEVLDEGTFLAKLGQGVSDFDLAGFSWPEPHILKLMTETDFGIGYYKDPDYQNLVAQAAVTTDPAERTRLYFDASKKML